MYDNTFRYLIQQLFTLDIESPNPVIAELPFTGVNFTKQLNSIGTFEGHLLLSGLDAYALNVAESTTPAKYSISVDWNGTILWSGVIWGREYNSDTQTLTIRAQEFGSYFDRRRITDTFVFYQTEVTSAITTLMDFAQNNSFQNAGVVPATFNKMSGNIGMNVIISDISPEFLTRTYHTYELKSVYQAILDIARNDVGVDLDWSAYWDGNYIVRYLYVAYPRLGTDFTDVYYTYPPTGFNNTIFSFPETITAYSYSEDGFMAANDVYYLGAGSNEGKLIVRAYDPTKIYSSDNPLETNVFPLLDDMFNHSDVFDETFLQNMALARVNAISTPPSYLQIVVPSYRPSLDSYYIGDTVNIQIKDDRFPYVIDPDTGEPIPGAEGLNAVYRITGINVSPGEDGPDRVTINLTLPVGATGEVL